MVQRNGFVHEHVRNVADHRVGHATVEPNERRFDRLVHDGARPVFQLSGRDRCIQLLDQGRIGEMESGVILRADQQIQEILIHDTGNLLARTESGGAEPPALSQPARSQDGLQEGGKLANTGSARPTTVAPRASCLAGTTEGEGSQTSPAPRRAGVSDSSRI